MPLGIDFAQVLLHMFNVVILFAGLYILLYAPVKKFMDARTEEYKKREDETKENLKKAEELKASYEERLNKAEDEIAEEKKKAAEELSKTVRETEAQAKEDARHILDVARAQAVKERAKIVSGARDDISKLIEDATRKIVEGGDPYEDFLADAERSRENGGE